MTEIKCQSAQCEHRATTHLTRKEGKVNVIHLCETHSQIHAQEQYDYYYTRIGGGAPSRVGNAVEFDIDYLYYNELQDAPHGRYYVALIERGGGRRIGFVVGSAEWFALDFELQKYKSPRPLTYHAFASAIAALGGQVKFVEIDRFHQNNSLYEAKLHIHQMNANVVVDLRPSDALVLTLVCGVPLLVSNAVLAALG
jgi:bifunctional DNase/RNase